MAQKLSVQKLKSMIGKQMAYALVDVREQEEFSKEHQLLSCCIPYARLTMFGTNPMKTPKQTLQLCKLTSIGNMN